MTDASVWEIGDLAAIDLGPESALLSSPDIADFGDALMQAAKGLTANPALLAQSTVKFGAELARVPGVALARWLGQETPPTFPLNPKDRRFADPAWSENPFFFAIAQAYLGLNQLTKRLIEEAGLATMTERKAQLAASLILDSLSPTNYPVTNPAVLKRAFETNGRSLVKGAQNFIDDLMHNNGRPRQVDTSSFTLGQNLAATPCKVVYRNDLMELLQYEPQSAQVHSAPLLCSPPWINKYYVMDLAPNRSFIEWAVRAGRTVFAISYRNPTPEMADVSMEDYLIKGPTTAMDVISDITGADTIDIVGLCMGGALTAITDAYFSEIGDTRIGTLTLLNTMLDYSDPGPLAMFTGSMTVDRLEKQMLAKGHLPGESMAGTFDILRANDLIFNYIVSNWLMGKKPPAFDILAWNSDHTRMPAAMHSFYLRNFYVGNKLAKDELEIADQRIKLNDIKKPTYVVSAENDHIVPWRSAYATTQLLSGDVRFVLSSGGHIAGIVNPPGPKGWYLTGDDLPPEADAWRNGSVRQAGSWWEDWTNWAAENAGEMIDPPPLGSDQYPVLEPGPGRYVLT